MGLLEIVVALTALLPGAVVLALAYPRREPAPARAPLPVRAVAVAIGVALVGAGVGVGLGFLVGGALATRGLPEGLTLVTTSPFDPLAARGAFAAVGALWLVTPGAAALLWLIASYRREPPRAALFGLVVGLAHGAGMAVGAVGWPLVAGMLVDLMRAPGLDLEATISLRAVVDAQVRVLTLFGQAGATVASVAMAASRSIRALRVALALTFVAIGSGCLWSAVLTPPDLLSQLLAGGLLAAAWIAGLAIAGARLAFGRRRREDAGPSVF